MSARHQPEKTRSSLWDNTISGYPRTFRRLPIQAWKDLGRPSDDGSYCSKPVCCETSHFDGDHIDTNASVGLVAEAGNPTDFVLTALEQTQCETTVMPVHASTGIRRRSKPVSAQLSELPIPNMLVAHRVLGRPWHEVFSYDA